MSCHQMEPKIYAYLHGILSEKERQLVANHLASCNECRIIYSQWKVLENNLAVLKAQEPPQDFTLKVMSAINNLAPSNSFKKYWLTNWYRNIGRGFIAAGVFGMFINFSVLVADLPFEKSIEKVFITVEELGSKYMQIYERVSLDSEIWPRKGGNKNEM